MTPAEVATLIDAAPMPPGYRLDVRPQRTHKYRSLWNVRVLHDGERVWGRAYYSITYGIVEGQRAAWSHGASSDRPDAGNTAESSHGSHEPTAVDGGRTAPVLPGSPEPSGDVPLTVTTDADGYITSIEEAS